MNEQAKYTPGPWETLPEEFDKPYIPRRQMRHIITPSGDVVLTLTRAEMIGLEALASDGAEGILTDAGNARGYIGGPAAVAAATRAVEAVKAATAAARKPRKGGSNG